MSIIVKQRGLHHENTMDALAMQLTGYADPCGTDSFQRLRPQSRFDAALWIGQL